MSNVTTCSDDCLEEEEERKRFIARLLQILEDSYWDDLNEEGERIGIEKGEQRLSNLLKTLEDVGRSDEILKAVKDEEYQEKLMKEFNL